MPIDITMPRLSDTMESGTILKWNVKEGDEVSAGDVVADIETDKATMEMQVYDDGTIAKLLVGEGESVSIGTKIAVLAEKGEDVEDAAKSDGGESRSASRKQESASADDDDGDGGGETATAADDREADDEQRDDEKEQGKDKDEKARTAAETSSSKSRASAKRDDASQKDGKAEDEAGESPVDSNGRIRVSPVARRLADDHQVDVRNIQGSGPGGRIIKRDVMNAIESGKETAASVPPSARRRESGQSASATEIALAAQGEDAGFRPLEERSIQLSNMRQTIAKRLVESKTTIPHYQVTRTFNMDALLALRTTLNEQLAVQGVKLSVNDFLVRACALAMHRHHEFNASWAEDHLEVHGSANIGVAIALPRERGGGLVVATIRDADQKGLRQISAETKHFGEKARTRGLSVEDMSDSTFTISNLGMYGVEHFTAIINPPNSAILAVGAAVQKPVVRDNQIVVGQEMQATLSCDHRVIDGAMAAEYLQTLSQLLENPASLLV